MEIKILNDKLSDSSEETLTAINKTDNRIQILKDNLSETSDSQVITEENKTDNKVQILKDKLSDSAESQAILRQIKTNEKMQDLADKIAELVIKVDALQSSVDELDIKVTTEEIVAELGTISDLTGININADVFNSDKHSFKTGLTGSHLSMQPGTIIYARDTSNYCLLFWVSSESYVAITPNKNVWQILNDFTFGLVSGDSFKYSFIGSGCAAVTSTSSAFRTLNSGCTIKGNLNAEYSGTSEFSEGIIVDELLQVEGDSYFTGDVDIEGPLTVTGNTEVDGSLTVKGDIIQQGESYETHAEKIYTKNDLIITRDGAVSGLTEGEYTGIQAELYDGEHDGQLVFDKDGVARVGDVGDLQAIATREDSPTDGAAAVWDSDTNKFVSKEIDATPTADSTNLVLSGGVKTALNGKQDTLTFDSTPTASSSNPVTSSGIKSALDGKLDTRGIDTTPTVDSTNLITSGAIAIEDITSEFTFNETYVIANTSIKKIGKQIIVTYQGALKTHTASEEIISIPDKYLPAKNQTFSVFVCNTTTFGTVVASKTNKNLTIAQISDSTSSGRLYFQLIYYLA